MAKGKRQKSFSPSIPRDRKLGGRFAALPEGADSPDRITFAICLLPFAF
jgi:hypothetical protein